MFCESCGSALRSGAKFCGSCGTKVGGASSAKPEPKTIDLAPSPLGLATCDLSIDDVTAETDSDGDVSLNVKYTVTNNTSEDWDYLVIRAQVLRDDGVLLEETRDTQEQTIAAGESNEFEAYLRFNAKTLGGASRTATVLMSVTACGAVIEALDQFDVPAQPFEMVELKPVRLGDHLRLISGGLLKRGPDSDGDVSVEVKALVQSLTKQHLPAVTLLAKINDKAMREITDATVTEEIRPGEVCVLSGYGNTKDKRLKDAKAALSIRAYYPLATGYCQHGAVEISGPASEESESIGSEAVQSRSNDGEDWIEVRLTPKRHAEWTFFPTEDLKKETGAQHDDVGLFMNAGEVLSLQALEPPKLEDGRIHIRVKEGRIEVVENEWRRWPKALEEAGSIFDIDRILKEYVED